MEVPEIYDGTVEIRSVAREAGDRSKILYMQRTLMSIQLVLVYQKGNVYNAL